MEKAKAGLLGRQRRNAKTESQTVKGRAEQRWASGGKGEAGPSPEDVETDVALEVNVRVINHCLTLHLGGVMWITLSHLAPEKKGNERGRCFGYASAAATSPPSHLGPPGTHLKTEHKLPTLVEALGKGAKKELRPPILRVSHSLWADSTPTPGSVLGNPATHVLLSPHQDR